MDGKGGKHMIEKAHAGGHAPLAAVQAKLDSDFRFIGFTVQ